MPRCNDALRNRLIDAVKAGLAGLSVLEAYTGAIPANGNTAPTGTLLWSFTFDSTPWGATSAGGASHADVPLVANAVANGTIGYIRARNSGSTESMYCTATTTGGGGEFEFGSLGAVSGQPVQITALNLNTTAIA